jgi:hypothetical protein
LNKFTNYWERNRRALNSRKDGQSLKFEGEKTPIGISISRDDLEPESGLTRRLLGMIDGVANAPSPLARRLKIAEIGFSRRPAAVMVDPSFTRVESELGPAISRQLKPGSRVLVVGSPGGGLVVEMRRQLIRAHSMNPELNEAQKDLYYFVKGDLRTYFLEATEKQSENEAGKYDTVLLNWVPELIPPHTSGDFIPYMHGIIRACEPGCRLIINPITPGTLAAFTRQFPEWALLRTNVRPAGHGRTPFLAAELRLREPGAELTLTPPPPSQRGVARDRPESVPDAKPKKLSQTEAASALRDEIVKTVDLTKRQKKALENITKTLSFHRHELRNFTDYWNRTRSAPDGIKALLDGVAEAPTDLARDMKIAEIGSNPGDVEPRPDPSLAELKSEIGSSVLSPLRLAGTRMLVIGADGGSLVLDLRRTGIRAVGMNPEPNDLQKNLPYFVQGKITAFFKDDPVLNNKVVHRTKLVPAKPSEPSERERQIQAQTGRYKTVLIARAPDLDASYIEGAIQACKPGCTIVIRSITRPLLDDFVRQFPNLEVVSPPSDKPSFAVQFRLKPPVK